MPPLAALSARATPRPLPSLLVVRRLPSPRRLSSSRCLQEPRRLPFPRCWSSPASPRRVVSLAVPSLGAAPPPRSASSSQIRLHTAPGPRSAGAAPAARLYGGGAGEAAVDVLVNLSQDGELAACLVMLGGVVAIMDVMVKRGGEQPKLARSLVMLLVNLTQVESGIAALIQRMNKTKIYSGRVRVTTALKLSCGLLLNLLVLDMIFVLTATVNPEQLRKHTTSLFNE